MVLSKHHFPPLFLPPVARSSASFRRKSWPNSKQVDEIVMITEDVMAKVFSCMGQKDDTLAKELLAGKVGQRRVRAVVLVKDDFRRAPPGRTSHHNSS